MERDVIDGPENAVYRRLPARVTERHGAVVSRKTGYKWIDRYLRQGPADLAEHSRRPVRSPNATSHSSSGGCTSAACVSKMNMAE